MKRRDVFGAIAAAAAIAANPLQARPYELNRCPMISIDKLRTEALAKPLRTEEDLMNRIKWHFFAGGVTPMRIMGCLRRWGVEGYAVMVNGQDPRQDVWLVRDASGMVNGTPMERTDGIGVFDRAEWQAAADADLAAWRESRTPQA